MEGKFLKNDRRERNSVEREEGGREREKNHIDQLSFEVGLRYGEGGSGKNGIESKRERKKGKSLGIFYQEMTKKKQEKPSKSYRKKKTDWGMFLETAKKRSFTEKKNLQLNRGGRN